MAENKAEAKTSDRTHIRTISAESWRGTPNDLVDLINNLISAIEDFVHDKAEVVYELKVGDEVWKPQDSDAFLGDLDKEAITRLKSASSLVVAGEQREHRASLHATPDAIWLRLESTSSLYISAVARFVEEELKRRRPPSSWSIPTYFFATGWFIVFMTFPWLFWKGANTNLLAIFAPFGVGGILLVIGALLRVQMPRIDLQADRDSFRWERFRNRAWRAALWLIPFALSILFFFLGRSTDDRDRQEEAANEVNAMYVAVAIDDEYWQEPPFLSDESRSYLIGDWEELNPYEVHGRRPLPAEQVRIGALWNGSDLNARRIKLRAFVTSFRTFPISAENQVRQVFDLGVDGESDRVECISTLPEEDRLGDGDYVAVMGVTVARGWHFAEGARRQTSFLACPQVQKLPIPS